MATIRTKGFTAKDLFNAASAISLKDCEGQILKVTDVAVVEKTFEEQVITYLKSKDGKVFASISPTIAEQAVSLAEMVEKTAVDVRVISKISNAGNTYIMLELA